MMKKMEKVAFVGACECIIQWELMITGDVGEIRVNNSFIHFVYKLW